MKELSIEEKAKAYDSMFERLKEMYNNNKTNVAARLIYERYFPELKESEDDKVRKKLIHLVKKSHEQGGYALHKWESDEMLAWLEKQGEKPQGKSALEAIKEENVDNADKFEPKFKVGDWVFIEEIKGYKQGAFQIKSIDEFGYNFDEYHTIPFMYEEILSKWTIQDAKAGDVLACKGNIKYSNGIKYERICLFNNIDNAFFTLTKNSNSVEEYDIDVNIDYPDNTVPATKEQKEILFMVMKEAGYKWDDEKKELKKIEKKPAAWSEEDETTKNNISHIIRQYDKISKRENQPCWYIGDCLL